MVCHLDEIDDEDVERLEKEKEVELKEVKDIEGKENEEKRKVIRHKNDRLRKLNNYDIMFDNEMAMFY